MDQFENWITEQKGKIMPTLIINNNQISFEPGQTILEVARKNNIEIPTLCYLSECMPTGQCRICVVEVDGGCRTFARLRDPGR